MDRERWHCLIRARAKRPELLASMREVRRGIMRASERGALIPRYRPMTREEDLSYYNASEMRGELIKMLEQLTDEEELLTAIGKKISFYAGQEETAQGNAYFDFWTQACYDLTGLYRWEEEKA